MYTIFDDIKVLAHGFFEDERGEIYTTWKSGDFDNLNFKQDKVVVSNYKALRGLHGDYSSTKYVTCTFGEVIYVFVDMRENSKTYKKFQFVILSSKNKLGVIFPPGFATGALTLSSVSVLNYKLSYPDKYPDVDQQFNLKWDDQELNIPWPIKDVILSERDR